MSGPKRYRKQRSAVLSSILAAAALVAVLPVQGSAIPDGVTRMDVKAVDTAGFVGQSGSNFGGSGSSGGPGGTVVMEEWLYTFRIYSLPPNVPIQVRGYDADGRQVTGPSSTAATNSSGFYSVASKIRMNKDKLIPMRMDIVVGNPGSTQSYSYTFTEFGSLTNSKNIVLNAELKDGKLVKKVL